MAQAVSRRPLNAETLVQSQVSPYEVCSRQSGTGADFFPVNIIPPMFRTPLHLHVALSRTTNGRSLGTFQSALPEIGVHCIERYFQFFVRK